MTARALSLLAALALAGCVAASGPPADRIGRIYSYVRSNSDGSEAERIHVFRASLTRVEVTKMRTRCTDAAFVTAELDLAAGQARRLTGGRLLPDAGHRDFAWLEHDRASRQLLARVELPEGTLRLSVGVPDEPWHIYDFDLASLTVTNPYRADPRASFSFGVPLIWPEGDMREALRYLGRADARFAGEEFHLGRRALRFEVGGPAFGDRGGPLWFDAAGGHVLEARFGLPNHPGYRDFRLLLTGISDGGEEAWRRLLTAHFADCPAAAP
ncbi:MAG: hypothetical protein ACT4OE_03855 [Sphingosinicella sp.]